MSSFKQPPRRKKQSHKQTKKPTWKLSFREGVEKKTVVHRTSVANLPVYGKDCFGTMCFYGPPKSGKTTLMSQILQKMIAPLQAGTNGPDDVAGVILFCPGERTELEFLKSVRGFAHVKSDYAKKLRDIMTKQETDSTRRGSRKLLLVWDDMFGTVSMSSKEMREACNALGAKARQPETNIVWVIAAQYPRFLSTGVRSVTHMSFFSNTSPDHIKMIVDAQNTHINSKGLYKIAHSHQFVGVDNIGGKIYVTKAQISPGDTGTISMTTPRRFRGMVAASSMDGVPNA